MPATPAAVEQVVIDAMLAASPDKSVRVTRDSEVLQLVDSLGLIMVLGNIQAALKITLDPKELIRVFQTRSLADLAQVLTAALSARSTHSA